jgi:glycosyltransferase involved in cell wall biosynthesis
MNYIIITPVKNEEKYIRQVLFSVCNQSVLPSLWVIIDGGSTDKTKEFINQTAESRPWIKLIAQKETVSTGETTHLNVSIAVKEAHDFAIEYCGKHGIFYSFIWTLDGDQILSPNTCSGIIDCMSQDGAGAASGTIQNPDGTKDVYPEGELSNKRVYSKVALGDIGGFPITKYSYDTVILAKLRMREWKIKTYPEYNIRNLRIDSGIERDSWRSSTQFGRARYYLGYSLPLLLAGCGYLVAQKKFGKAAGIFCGYLGSWLRRDEVIPDPGVWEHFHTERLREVLNNTWIEPKHMYWVFLLVGIFLAGLFVWRFFR